VDHAYKIDVRGVIDLLSNRLHRGPEVFVRELLQNAVDAILAREQYDPDTLGEITIEVFGGKTPSLVVLDNGIGLSEDEVHRFLATIGRCSRREVEWEQPENVLGRFGIGLLSCFVVSDEIAVVTRSAIDPRAKTVEWRGRPDGTFTVRTVDHEISPGTQVYLSCKPGSEEWFQPERLGGLARHFGGLLPYPIRVAVGNEVTRINSVSPPWRRRFASTDEQTRVLLDYGREAFGIEFFDAIPLKSRPGGVDGVAFVLPSTPNLAFRQAHKIYLRGMLLSEDSGGLLPEWAFFVKSVVNTNSLRPMASREALCEDIEFETTRTALGGVLRDYLVGLAARNPAKLQKLIALHARSIKGLALQDDEFYILLIDWLWFETSLGPMTLGEYRDINRVVLYVTDFDRFRQIVRVAAALELCIINARNSQDAALLSRLPQLIEGAQAEVFDPADLAQNLEELSVKERAEIHGLIVVADRVLARFHCEVEARKFGPDELPGLYTNASESELYRASDPTMEGPDPSWADVPEELEASAIAEPRARLTLNYHNPLIRKLARITDITFQERSIEMLYMQALLLGHHPIGARELALLNGGLIGLIDRGLSALPRREGP
jgi:molecular chaperone HtpG